MSITIYNDIELSEAIETLAEQICSSHKETLHECVFIGIIPRGVPIAKRLAHYILKKRDISIPVGQLDVSLYRENLSQDKNRYIAFEETDIPFRLKNKIIILINDIFYEGQGARAALNSLLDFDSPKKIELAVLIDRGNRTLPIHPDYTIKKTQTHPNDIMETKLLEINGVDGVFLTETTSSTQKA